MKRLAIVALGALALSGCTGTHIKAPAVCDGKHRRPANLYGTILPTLPVPLPASQGGGGQSMVAPPTGAAVPDVSGPAPLPPPPSAPAPVTVLPDTPSAPAPAPKPGAMNTPPSAPRTSQRAVALSYLPC